MKNKISKFTSKNDFKELVHLTVGAGNSEFCRAGWQAGDTVDTATQVQRRREDEFLLPGGTSVFVS